jgi:hypothetical protein
LADPILAMIGAIVLFVLGAGAIVALVVYSAQAFLALFRSMRKF